MNEIIPWNQWVEIIRPYYYDNKRGRRPKDIEVMLRMYLTQNCFNLSDEGMEEAIYDSYAMRSFLGINFLDEQIPDSTTLLKFHHLLEKHHIGENILHRELIEVLPRRTNQRVLYGVVCLSVLLIHRKSGDITTSQLLFCPDRALYKNGN